LSGKRDERKATDHVAVRDVVVGTAFRRFALALQDPIVIAVIGLAAPTRLGAVSLSLRLHHERTDRTFLFAGSSLPVEAVVLAGAAQEFLGVFDKSVVVAVLLCTANVQNLRAVR
jgi:hypothetical protein